MSGRRATFLQPSPQAWSLDSATRVSEIFRQRFSGNFRAGFFPKLCGGAPAEAGVSLFCRGGIDHIGNDLQHYNCVNVPRQAERTGQVIRC